MRRPGQFLVAVFVYHETINAHKLASFVVIWVALRIYSVDSWRSVRDAARRSAKPQAAIEPVHDL